MDFFRRQEWDIVGRAWIWLGLSLILIVGGLGTALVGGLNYGIDFTGGSLLKFQFDETLASSGLSDREVIAQTRALLADHGLATSQTQVSGGNQLLIRTPQMAEAEAARQEGEIAAGLQELFGAQAGAVSSLGREMVGPVVGRRLTNRALLALVLGSIFILIYIAIRYEFIFGVAGVVALIHDVCIVIGAMAVFRTELNTEFVAAILTMVGYSINDTIVIFDRIRENTRLHRGREFASVINSSLLQTLSRSINTSATTLFGLLALFFFGGPAIRPFALALIVGVTTGTYSSIFIASPLVVLWQKRRASRSASVTRPTPAAVGSTRGRPAGTESVAGPQDSAAQEAVQRLQQDAQAEKQEERRKRRGRKKEKSGRKRF